MNLYEITFIDGETIQEYGSSIEDVTAFCEVVYSTEIQCINLVSE